MDVAPDRTSTVIMTASHRRKMPIDASNDTFETLYAGSDPLAVPRATQAACGGVKTTLRTAVNREQNPLDASMSVTRA